MRAQACVGNIGGGMTISATKVKYTVQYEVSLIPARHLESWSHKLVFSLMARCGGHGLVFTGEKSETAFGAAEVYAAKF